MAVGVLDRLGPTRDAELAVDVREVELHRLLGDPELLRDLPVREAVAECREDRELTLTQTNLLRRRGLLVQRPERLKDGSLDGLPQSRGEVARVDLLSDERCRTSCEGRTNDVGIFEAGQDHDLDVRMPL